MGIFDDVFDRKIDFSRGSIRVFDLFFSAVILFLGIYLRMTLYDIESGDYESFLKVWMEECHNVGGIRYLGITPFASNLSTINYGWMYQYILILIHYLSSFRSELYLIKDVSVIFDVVCAVTICRITFLASGGNVRKSVISFAGVLLLPTVILNSGAWAQCDSIYAAFVLLSLYHLMKNNNRRMFIYLGLAYSFKLQTIFILPVLVIMWLKGKVKLKYVFYAPLVYFTSMIPALLSGRKFGELISIYSRQSSTYKSLTKNYPSMYAVISEALPEDYKQALISAGMAFTICVLGIAAYYLRDNIREVNYELIITIAIFLVELCLFTLPVMHERYGYIPEVLAVSFAVLNVKRFYICAALQFISLITYSRFLFGSTVTIIWPLSVAMLVMIIAIGYDLHGQLKRSEV